MFSNKSLKNTKVQGLLPKLLHYLQRFWSYTEKFNGDI